MDGWTRIHRRSGYHDGMLIVACLFPLSFGLPVLIVEPGLATLAFVAVTALPILFAWRLRRTGIYVSDHGVRLQWPLHSRVVPWQGVYRVTLAPRTFEAGLTLGDAVTTGWGQSVITIITPTADRIWTPVAEFGRGRTLRATIVALSGDEAWALASYLDHLAAQHNGRVLTGGWEGDLY